MGLSVAWLVAVMAVVIGLPVAYGKTFSPYQTQLAQWVIDAGAVPKRWRGPVNLATGLAIAAAVTVVGAVQIGEPGLIAVGVLAGVFSSDEVARIHVQAMVQRVDRPGYWRWTPDHSTSPTG
jgi:hypothetical protein